MKNKKLSSKIELVYVEWEDAEFLQHGWAGADEIKERAEAMAVVRTAGFCLEKTKEYILVAGSLAVGINKDDGASDVMKIPAGMIRKLVKIKDMAVT